MDQFFLYIICLFISKRIVVDDFLFIRLGLCRTNTLIMFSIRGDDSSNIWVGYSKQRFSNCCLDGSRTYQTRVHQSTCKCHRIFLLNGNVFFTFWIQLLVVSPLLFTFETNARRYDFINWSQYHGKRIILDWYTLACFSEPISSQIIAPYHNLYYSWCYIQYEIVFFKKKSLKKTE